MLVGELRHHWRRRGQLTVHLFYALLLAYVIQLVVDPPTPPRYITFFWLASLFTNLQLGTESYHHETRRHLLFYYWMIPPVMLFWIRALLNAVMQAVAMGALAGLFTFFWGPLPIAWWQWALLIVLAALGFGFAFSIISAVARFARQPFLLMSILGIPVILPLLYSCIHLHTALAAGDPSIRLWLTLPALWGILAGMGSILIPHLQRH